MENIKLIIEKGENSIWGGVLYNNNLIVEEANSPNELELKLKALLNSFEGVNPNQIKFIRQLQPDKSE